MHAPSPSYYTNLTAVLRPCMLYSQLQLHSFGFIFTYLGCLSKAVKHLYYVICIMKMFLHRMSMVTKQNPRPPSQVNESWSSGPEAKRILKNSLAKSNPAWEVVQLKEQCGAPQQVWRQLAYLALYNPQSFSRIHMLSSQAFWTVQRALGWANNLYLF